MKKIISFIIISLCFFSISNYVNANQGELDRLLNLEYGPEELEFNLQKVGDYYFKEKNTYQKFKTFKRLTSLLREAFIKKYKSGDLSYYHMNGIVTNYNLFVYHINKYFLYLSLREKNQNYSEVDTAIINSYILARSYLKQVKYIYSL